MNQDLDQLLGALSARAPHPRLDSVSAAVLDRIAAPSRPANLGLVAALAAFVALGMGMAGTWSERAEARQAVALDAGHALAPSTLLGGG